MDDSESDGLAERTLQLLRTRRDLYADAENLSAQSLDKARQITTALPPTYRGLAQALGLSDGVLKMIAAEARLLAAAEAEFQASVGARKAIEAVGQGGGRRRGREPSDGLGALDAIDAAFATVPDANPTHSGSSGPLGAVDDVPPPL